MNKLFIAVMYSHAELYRTVKDLLSDRFGLKLESEPYDFDQFTNYYELEMGKGLAKRFLIFERNILRKDLITIKKETTEIEKQFSKEGKRQINLDPGYFNKDELALASFKKGTDYKEELGQGVYAHKVLEFNDGKAIAFWHTFPDYRKNTD